MYLPQTLDFIYKSCSNRVATKIKASGLTQAAIYPSNPKQLSCICKNKRTKRNRFLICDAVLSHPDPSSGEIVGLVPKLKFRNKQEVLWGTDSEIEDYLPQLFEAIMLDLLSYKLNLKFSIEDVLCDYVPYAKYSTYHDLMCSSTNSFAAMIWGMNDNDLAMNLEPAKENAIKFLYQKYKKEFSIAFIQFSSTTESFKKIDSIFDKNFVQKSFIPLITKNLNDRNSLGLRVKNLILADLSQVPTLMTNQNEAPEYYRHLIRASSTYILALEEIQQRNTKSVVLNSV